MTAAAAQLSGRPALALPAPWVVLGVLVLAWLCANRPQPLAYAVADWLGDATTFSHQRRLADDVRALLAATARATPEPATLAATEVAPRTALPALPACPEGSLLKRPEWSLADTLAVTAPEFSRGCFATFDASPPASLAADVPHPPPRATA